MPSDFLRTFQTLLKAPSPREWKKEVSIFQIKIQECIMKFVILPSFPIIVKLFIFVNYNY